MKQVTIRRCPTCSTIGSHTDQLLATLSEDQDMNVHVVYGNKGEFNIEVDGRHVPGMTGSDMRPVDEIANDIRGKEMAAV